MSKYQVCWRSKCSNSLAERSRNAADSLYPAINCFTAAISPGFRENDGAEANVDVTDGPSGSCDMDDADDDDCGWQVDDDVDL